MKNWKVYIGRRDPNDHSQTDILVDTGDGTYRLRATRYWTEDIFEWGYSGSGPNETAASILADYLGEPLARGRGEEENTLAGQLAIKFTSDVISLLPREGFRLHETEVQRWLTHTVVAALKRLRKLDPHALDNIPWDPGLESN